MLVVRSVAVGWRWWVALMDDVVLLGMELVGFLSVFDVLFMLVSMIGA